MARLEIPSIIVHNGSQSSSESPAMNRPSRPQVTLSKQSSLLDDNECDEGVEEAPDNLLIAESSPEHQSVPVTPPSPSPPSGTPMSAGDVVTCTANAFHHQQSKNPSPIIPQGPGPGGGEGSSPAESNGGSSGSGPPRSRSLELPQQRSSDSDKDAPSVTSSRHKHHGAKLKLLQRSLAMREDTSPPPDMLDVCGFPSAIYSGSSNTLTVSPAGGSGSCGAGGRRRLRHQGSSQGSCEGSSPSLSRDSSTEYTDSSGVDLHQFIIQTLHKNQKDRMMLLKIERELISLNKDAKRTHHKFPPMSSYQRMLVHRCAAYFGLEHNVDQAGTAVIVNKTKNSRLPETRFRDHCRDEFFAPDEPKKSILRREFSSFDDGSNFRSFLSTDGMGDSPCRGHSSRRNSHDDTRWQDPRQWSLGESEIIHRRHYYDNQRLRPGRLPKVESFESRDTLHPRSLRPPVFKSHSFGGYTGGVTVLSRGESVASNYYSSRLSKQDSTSSRISDHSSSSGYKTQRQDTSSTSVSNTFSTTPSPTAPHHQHPSFGQTLGVWGSEGDGQAVMWAVTDMDSVPPGAMLINPQSGQPYVNPDGSVYRYDPSNPPHFIPLPGLGKATGDKDCGKEKELDAMPGSDVHSNAPPSISSTSPPQELTSHSTPDSSGHPSPSPQQQSSGDPPHCSISGISGESVLPAESPCAEEGVTEEGDVGKGTSCGTLSSRGGGGTATSTAGGGGSGTTSCGTSGVASVCGSSTASRSGTEGPVNAPVQVIYPHYVPPHMESRPYSHDPGVGEMAGQLRGMCLGGPVGGSTADVAGDVATPPQVSGSTSVPPAYVLPRQPYSQPVYYMPTGSGLTGAIKYVYPQYQVGPIPPPPASLQGTPGVQTVTVQSPVVQPAAGPAVQAIQGVPALPAAVPSVPAAMPAHGPPQTQTQSVEAGPALPPGGFMPGGYTVVAYPSGVLGTSTAGGGQEAGGTTYYCQLPGPAGPVGHATSAPGQPAIAPATSLQQYAIPPSSSAASFPPLGSGLGYYTASGMSGMSNSGMYQGTGVHGVTGGLYGTPQISSAGSAPAAVAYRAQTPPQTPSTQGLNLPLGFVGGGGSNSSGGVAPPPLGIGGQYVAVLHPQQPSTPTSHAPSQQLFTTFLRPSVPMLGGSTGTPPPQPVLHYGGAAAPVAGPPCAMTPHPPVFAKPFLGSAAMHPLMTGGNSEQQGGGQGSSKDDAKRFITGPPHSSGSASSGVTGTHQLLTRPYTFMQNDIRLLSSTGGLTTAGSLGGGNLAGPGGPPIRAGATLLISGPRPRHPLASTNSLATLSLTRPPKVRRQKSRTSQTRSSEGLSYQTFVCGQESSD